MDIPEFPQSRPLSLEDKPLLDRSFAALKSEVSQYTFTNIFAWRRARRTEICRFGGQKLIFQNRPEGGVFLTPLGEGDGVTTIKSVLEAAAARGAEFAYLPAVLAETLRQEGALSVEEDRDNSDYLYLADDLTNLPGRKYDAKRNFINRFKSEHDYRYLETTVETARRCMQFEEHWCSDRSCQSDEGLSHEMDAVLEMLANFEALGIQGGAIEVAGSIVAFSLGEALNPETLVVHVEKADAKLQGVYAVINNEFCRLAATGFKYVNREQDLGVPGLRQAKLSYHPLRIIPTFRARPAPA